MMIPEVSTYILFNGLGFIAAVFLLERELARHLPARMNTAYTLLVLAVPVGWLSAHVFDWLTRGGSFATAGFVFYGGFLGSLVFVAIAGGFLLRRRDLWTALNAGVVPLLVAQAIGRIGCLFQGCCHGQFIAGTTWQHPVPLYESIFAATLAGILTWRGDSNFHRRATIYLIGYATFRLGIGFLRGDDRAMAFGLSSAQWIAAGIVVVMVVLWCVARPARGFAGDAIPATTGRVETSPMNLTTP